MRFLDKFLFFIVISIVYSGAIINDDEDNDEVKSEHVHDHKLSDHEHFTDLDNDNNLEHNDDYDHEAFLGKEEAEKFKELTPEESKERLAKITEKIDVDHDEFISEEELHEWIKSIKNKYLQRDVDKRWETYDSDNNGSFTLEHLIDINYGALKFWSDEEKINRKKEFDTYTKLMKRDTNRFKVADADNSGTLNKTEYSDFLHPEESKRMRIVVIEETIEDLDKDHDGFVDVDEFLDDLYPNRKDENFEGEEPYWIKSERENFVKYRDIDGDGKLNKEEVGNWVLPSDYDHTLAEAKHLIFEADKDKDNRLTKEEILNKSSLFVSSQATGYGEAIYEHEDL